MTDPVPRRTNIEAILSQLRERQSELEKQLNGINKSIEALEEGFDLHPLSFPASFSASRQIGGQKE